MTMRVENKGVAVESGRQKLTSVGVLLIEEFQHVS